MSFKNKRVVSDDGFRSRKGVKKTKLDNLNKLSWISTVNTDVKAVVQIFRQGNTLLCNVFSSKCFIQNF